MKSPLTIHAYASVKGGVGKSSLAVVSALHLARQGRGVVILDADLTGSSLGDGLALRAPRVTLNKDGVPDLSEKPTGEFLTWEETKAARQKRLYSLYSGCLPPPYLNDVLALQSQERGECTLGSVLWQHADEPRLRVLPSSSLRKDVLVALGWIYREEHLRFGYRMGHILYALLKQIEGLDDIVIDLPPGFSDSPTAFCRYWRP